MMDNIYNMISGVLQGTINSARSARCARSPEDHAPLEKLAGSLFAGEN